MFNFCAVHYLHQWLTLDRPCFEDAQKNKMTLDQLSNYLYRYGALRTIPGNGPDRLEIFWQHIIKLNLTKSSTAETIHRCHQELSNQYNKKILSVISKSAWMKHRHPVVLYDSKAYTSLRRLRYDFRKNDYKGYYRAWMDFFHRDEIQSELNDACAFVPTSCFAQRLIAHGVAKREEIREWSKSDWFRNRVVDMRLWHMADNDKVKEIDLARLLGHRETR